jgi:hypothetical protein
MLLQNLVTLAVNLATLAVKENVYQIILIYYMGFE